MDAPTDPQERIEERAAARAALSRLRTMAGDEREYADLREYVIKEYMSYARYLAGKYRRRGEALSDLEQVAYVGLVKAVDNFDPEYGTSFLTYATPMITGEIKRHFRDTTWDVHVPRRLQELSAAVRAAEAELTQKLGAPPSAAELADRLGLAADELAEVFDASVAYTASSLDVPVAMADGNGATLGDLLGNDDPGIEMVVNRAALKPLLAELGAREKRILLMRFFRNMSQSQIGAELGVSQMQVSRLLTQILGGLRARLGAAPGPGNVSDG